MVETNPNQIKKKNKKDFFNLFLEVFGFIRIVASPLLIGLTIGFGAYIVKQDDVGLIIAISIASIGLIIGIIWAIKISRKQSTLDYITTASSPEFDKFDKEPE